MRQAIVFVFTPPVQTKLACPVFGGSSGKFSCCDRREESQCALVYMVRKWIKGVSKDTRKGDRHVSRRKKAEKDATANTTYGTAGTSLVWGQIAHPAAELSNTSHIFCYVLRGLVACFVSLVG